MNRELFQTTIVLMYNPVTHLTDDKNWPSVSGREPSIMGSCPGPKVVKHSHTAMLDCRYDVVWSQARCVNTHVFLTVSLLTHLSIKHSSKRFEGHEGKSERTLQVLVGKKCFLPQHTPTDAIFYPCLSNSGILITDLNKSERRLYSLGCFFLALVCLPDESSPCS